ncbi:MAG: FG-GAP-like repeat-containing protein [Phycisphaerae bacterium]
MKSIWPSSVLAAAVVLLPHWSSIRAQVDTPDRASELDTRRLVGKAYYENDKFAEAAEEFRRCIELAPDSAVDHFNLGLVLMRATKFEDAHRMLERAQQLDAKLLAAYYVQGIVYKRQGESEKAARSLEYVLKHDPACIGAYYNLGVCQRLMQQHEEAIESFRKVLEINPRQPSSHYQLMTLYRRIGDMENAKHHRELFDRLKDTVDPSEKTAEALERSKYSYIIEVPRLTGDLPAAPDAKVRFEDVTREAGLAGLNSAHGTRHPSTNRIPGGGPGGRPVSGEGSAVELADYDGDGDLDIYVVNTSPDPKGRANRLYRNNGHAKFVDASSVAGVADTGMGLDAVFGDYDHDGRIDLYVGNFGPNVLYHNNGDGTFSDVSTQAHVDEPQSGRKVLFFDYDHDNDLDIFVGNSGDLADTRSGEAQQGQSDTLLRNNGDGTFADQTDEAGLLVGFNKTTDAVFADLDGDHDVDLFVGNDESPSILFINLRQGIFASGGSFSPPLPTRVASACEGDFNRDGNSDLCVAAGDRGRLLLCLNDGHASFTCAPVPAAADWTVERVYPLDYNNDGWNDLLVLQRGGDDKGDSIHLLAGAGKAKFQDVTDAVALDDAMRPISKAGASRSSALRIAGAAVGDLDGDGDVDFVVYTRDQQLRLMRNGIDVHPVGKKVNSGGYGSTIEIASSGHYQKQTVRDGIVHFGIGELKQVDVVRVTWPNGTAQNVIRPKINSTTTIEEYVRVSASCGFLYAFNGTRFQLVNEILGIGPLGVPMSPGVYYPLDDTELTKIAAHELAPKNGYYELRLTEELNEITYADQITLRVVDHPAELEVFPNEMFSSPPPEDKFFAVADQRPPLTAVDEQGRDVLPLIAKKDGRFPTFPLVEQYDGLAELHTLTLDLGDLSRADLIVLFLDGWVYWPDSSVGTAIGQDPRFDVEPLSLEILDERGQWQIAIDSVGLPTSKGLVVPVDLTGRFRSRDYHVRLSTNMRIYFDHIFVSTRDEADRCRVTELPVSEADLHYRGFSRMTRDEFGFERFDYHDVSSTGSWDPPAGLFTRYGDVTLLLSKPDDMYVIFGPGDELAMRFDATSLPRLPKGWTRDFIFFAGGWVKDGDLNTKFSESVEPLPFHGMSGYPYPAAEHYPATAEHARYIRDYNTRPGGRTTGVLGAAVRPGSYGR